MQNLINHKNDKPVVSTVAIAECAKVQHRNVIALVRKYLSDFLSINPVMFEVRQGAALPQGGFAKSTEVAYLDENQTILLLSFLKNTENARKLKVRIIKEFHESRKELAARKRP